MKRTLLAAALFAASAAHAAFTGGFAPANWTQTPGTGLVNSFSTTDLSMSSGNSGSNNPSNTDVTIALLGGGTVSFNWDYTTSDSGPPLFDPFSVLNPSPSSLQLTIDLGANTQNGTYSFIANAGDVIGFRIRTVDNLFGSATVRISNFNFAPGDPAPNPAPEPGGVALMAAALLAGLAARRRLKGAGATA